MLQQMIAASSGGLEFTEDKLVRLLFFFTIALVCALVVIGFTVRRFNLEKFKDFSKTTIGILIGYSLAIIVIMLYSSFSEDVGLFDYGKVVPLLFYPLFAVIIIAVVTGIAVWIASLFNKKAVKYTLIAGGVLELGAFIAVMVCMTKFYNMIKDDPEYAATAWLDFSTVNTAGLIGTGIAFIIVIAIIFMLGSKHKEVNNTRAIVYGAISIAMSFALSYVKFMSMPQGGSVTFASLLPLMVYCCMFGTRRGVIAGLIYGVLQAIQDPWIIHPMQFLLDYPLAFGVIGISGLFVEKNLFKGNKIVGFAVGAVVAVFLRYLCHVCSGVFAFASYAGDGYTAVAWGFLYNSFAFVDMLIAIVAGVFLFASSAFTKQLSKSSARKAAAGVDVQIIEEDADELDLLLSMQSGELTDIAPADNAQADNAQDVDIQTDNTQDVDSKEK